MMHIQKYPLKSVILALTLLSLTFDARTETRVTYLGGSQQEGDNDRFGFHATLDPWGDVIVVGMTASSDFPVTSGAYATANSGGYEMYVAKLSGDLSTLLAATYLGSSGDEQPWSVACDQTGNVYVAGVTTSSTFPITPGSAQSTLSGTNDGFVVKLDNDLTTLLGSTYIGGNGTEARVKLALDAAGNIFIMGTTSSNPFPTTLGCFDDTYGGYGDFFVSKLSNDLTTLVASTYVGGADFETFPSLSIDKHDNVIISGSSGSSDYPTTEGAYDRTLNGAAGNDWSNLDVVVTRLDNNLTSVLASTYLGSSGYEGGLNLAISSDGAIYVGGHTFSATYPTTVGVWDPVFSGSEFFVSCLDSGLTTLVASTFTQPGSAAYWGFGDMKIDSHGELCFAGIAETSGFLTTDNGFDRTYNGGWEGVVVRLSADLKTLLYASYLGGSLDDGGTDILIGPDDAVYVYGFTESGDFPVTPESYDATFNGSADAFVAKMHLAQFTRVTDGPHVNDSTTSEGVCWVDYDNDDDLDIYVSNDKGLWGGNNCLYENQGNGTYIKRTDLAIVQDTTFTYAASWGDLDNDGHLDLAVANFREKASVIYMNDGAGGFEAVANGPLSQGPVGATNVSWIDYNLDGLLDLFQCNATGPGFDDYPPWENYLFLNDGGTLDRIVSGDIATRARHSYGASWSDIDGDAYPDLVVPNNLPDLTDLYRNLGDGTFTRDSLNVICAGSANSGGSSWADYDNDGDMDLFLANFSPGPSYLYKNNGDGTFTSVTGRGLGLTNGRALGGVWGDYDNDGDQDIFVWLSAWDIQKYEGQLFENLGDGTFAAVGPDVLQCDSCAAHAAVWGDDDRDGDLDLYISRAELYFQPPTPPRPEYATNMLFRNNGNNNHWLVVKPEGVVSNRSAFGTKIKVYATIGGEPVTQLREMTSQTARLVEAPMECHFGLGDATMVDSLVIDWPRGITDVYTDVTPDQLLKVVEGSSDIDGDGVTALTDNCPFVANPLQEDSNEDGIGDACCCTNPTGNVDGDPVDVIDIGDLTALISYLFIPPYEQPVCLEEANVDGIEPVDIGDLTALIGYLFIPPYEPPANC